VFYLRDTALLYYAYYICIYYVYYICTIWFCKT